MTTRGIATEDVVWLRIERAKAESLALGIEILLTMPGATGRLFGATYFACQETGQAIEAALKVWAENHPRGA